MEINHLSTNNNALLTGRLVIILAVILSAIQFLYNRSLWLDEAMLALNIINKSHLELFQPLDMRQVAPILYLQLTKLFSIITPETEHGLRLFPLLCFWAALILFHKTARILFKDTLTAILVISLFALNFSLIYYSSELKQYMTDLLVAVLFLFLVVKYDASTQKKLWPMMIAGMVAIWFSNVAPIILFATGMYLLQQSVLCSKKGFWKLTGVIASWLLSFGIYYILFLHGHPTREFMQLFWSNEHAFMPLNPLSVDFFSFMVYRMGGLGRMSFSPFVAVIALFYILVPIGYFYLITKRKTGFLMLLALPVLTHLALSAAELYPFIGRLILYLSPYLILSAGYGFKFVIEKGSVAKKGLRIAYLIIPVLFLAQLLWDFPQKRHEIKDLLTFISENRQPGDKLYVAPGSFPAYTYYAQTAYFCPEKMVVLPSGAWVSSVDTFFENTIMQFTGPCWLLFSHNLEKAEYTIKRLKEMGIMPVKAFETKGSATYLYHFNYK